MAEKIFWDTWAFLALADPRFRFHDTAKIIHDTLERRRCDLVTTKAVLSEVGNGLSKLHLRRYVSGQLDFVNSMIKVKRGQVLDISNDLWQDAWDLYLDRPDKEWGHTDCISFVVMRELGLTTAFTADHHFEQAGFIRLVKVE